MIKKKYDIARHEIKPISVNWHFWPWCNRKCRFCFVTFQNIKKIPPKENTFNVPRMLEDAGTEKLTLVGGEPMLCPYIGDLLIAAKDCELATKIVSNGTGFTDKFLKKYHNYIDTVSLSLDSSYNDVETQLGRGNGHVNLIREVTQKIREFDISLQINTTVTKLTYQEDMHTIINELKPFRWKVFQVLPIEGENDGRVDDLLITDEEFDLFKRRHSDILQGIFECNDDMIGSYIMLDPIGRFFQNDTGKYVYSDSIFDVGVITAFQQVVWDKQKFEDRGGIYDWHSRKINNTSSMNSNIHKPLLVEQVMEGEDCV